MEVRIAALKNKSQNYGWVRCLIVCTKMAACQKRRGSPAVLELHRLPWWAKNSTYKSEASVKEVQKNLPENYLSNQCLLHLQSHTIAKAIVIIMGLILKVALLPSVAAPQQQLLHPEATPLLSPTQMLSMMNLTAAWSSSFSLGGV